MKKITISIPSGFKYLSEVKDEAGNKFQLPNGILNKEITGCGGTTLALEDEFKTVICSPRRKLIENKAAQYPNSLLVIEGVTEDKIREYIIDEFNQTGDLTAIKSIPWKEWRLPDPFNRELRNIDPETGKKIDKKPEQNIGHILQHARMEKDKKRANELYRDAAL